MGIFVLPRTRRSRIGTGSGTAGRHRRCGQNNPRYTGYAVFGRSTKHETLLDPDDVAAGYVTRFRRADSESVVRSRKPAHPEIVSVQTFTDVAMMRRSRAAGGLASRRNLERGAKATKWTYVLRGRVRCGYCELRMEGTPRADRAARSVVPGSAVLERRPKNVYLSERAVLRPVNAWLDGLFDDEHREETVRRMLNVDDATTDTTRLTQVRARAADAEKRLHRLKGAIEAGANPAALIDSINRAQDELEAAQEE